MAEPSLAPVARDVVVVGASAGGVEALRTLVGELPPDFAPAVLVVLHLPEGGTSFLADILDRAGPLPARTATHDDGLRPGTITVAAPDHHLVVTDHRARLLRGPKVNSHRPSIDVLFHSAARSLGPHVVGVVLSGALSDGALGLRAIKRRGGKAIVQADPAHQGMPASALQTSAVDAVVPVREVAAALTMLSRGQEAPGMDDQRIEESELEAGFDVGQLEQVPGSPTMFRCPECGGALWELEDGEAVGYTCHVGHTFSTESMLEQHGNAVERALWSAVEMLKERAVLLGRLAERMERGGNSKSAVRFESRAKEAEAQAAAIQDVIERPTPAGTDVAARDEAA